jgi:uncharacterized protein (TIGR00251 family)
MGVASGSELKIRVIPRAGRTAVAGMRGDALLVRLAAAPVDGAANDALIAFLSELFERPKRDITIVSGQKSRDKRVRVAGLTARDLESKLSGILPA